ncbi:S-adenosyl-L-methionine-dependent methyltransferase [Ceratobasidium sp. AG-I]|nr:S-adenosyl-L-methionine-dependent methyltransferase [Ceratobasidium sp. AG-I]
MASTEKVKIPKTNSSVHDIKEDAPPFGSRFLTEDQDVWSKNAWDHVPPPPDQTAQIEKALGRQRDSPVPKDTQSKYNDNPASFWDRFYKWNEGNFFRDRKWLHQEFPELTELTDSKAGEATVVEIGCGAGNTVFPLLETNQNPNLSIIGCDYSAKAIEVVKAHPLYTSPHIGSVSAHVWDLSGASLPPNVDSGTVDVVVMVFVLSALHPAEWANAVHNVYRMLKPGGLVVLRDYGRYDLTQLRFKEGRLLDDNFYVRGDGTRVYFFDLDELALLFTGAKAPTKGTSQSLVEPMLIEGNETPSRKQESVKFSISPALEPDDVSIVTVNGGAGTSTIGSSAGNWAAPSSAAVSGSALEDKAASDAPGTPELAARFDSLSMAETQSYSPALRDTHTQVPPKGHATPPAPSNEVHPPSEEHASPDIDLGYARACVAETNATPGIAHPLFSIAQLGIDRRLLVNRKRQLQMYRVWMQGKFRKVDTAVRNQEE